MTNELTRVGSECTYFKCFYFIIFFIVFKKLNWILNCMDILY